MEANSGNGNRVKLSYFAAEHHVRMEMLVQLLLLVGGCWASRPAQVDHVYQDGPSHTLYYDPGSGTTIVGGVNQVTFLDSDLRSLRKIKTGPTVESPDCPPPWINNCTCKEPNSTDCVPRKSIIKSLTVDHGSDMLVYCTSSFGGTCYRVPLSVPSKVSIINDFLINGETGERPAPLISIVSPGPETGQFLYLGSSWNEMSRYRDAEWARTPSLAALSLTDFRILRESRGNTTLYMRDSYRKQKFTLLYKYAFNYKGFNYFLTVQQKSLQSREFESRIGRLCVGDPWFSSYTEIKLACDNDQPPEASYNVLTAAYLSSPQNGFDADNAELFVTFAQSYAESYDALANSALCIYKMADIQQAFTGTISNCFSLGKGAKVGPDHFVTSRPCQPSVRA